jgi:hypothetical protein
MSVFADWHLKVGLPWHPRIEHALLSSKAVAVLIGPEGLGGWQLPEVWMALDIQQGARRNGRDFPVIPVLLPGSAPSPCFLLQNTWVDLRGGRDIVPADLLISALSHRDLIEVSSPINELCPYKGLDAFREEDEALFFGRDREVDRILKLVQNGPANPRQANIAAIVGPSGSGKSSLVDISRYRVVVEVALHDRAIVVGTVGKCCAFLDEVAHSRCPLRMRQVDVPRFDQLPHGRCSPDFAALGVDGKQTRNSVRQHLNSGGTVGLVLYQLGNSVGPLGRHLPDRVHSSGTVHTSPYLVAKQKC